MADNWKIVFEGDFIIIIVVIIIATLIIAYLINALLTKKSRAVIVLLFIIRLLTVLMIALLFLKPVYEYTTIEEEILDVPLIIDSSFSLNDAIETDEGITSKKDYLNSILEQHILNNSAISNKINVVIYDPLSKSFIENKEQLSTKDYYGIFDLSQSLSLVNSESTSYPKAMFLSDYGLSYSDSSESYYTPLFFIAPELRNKDVYINDVRFDEEKSSIVLNLVSLNSTEEEIDCSLYIKDKLITSKVHQSTKGINRVDIPLPSDLTGKHIVKTEIQLLESRYDNPLNNTDYVSIDIKKEKDRPTIHYYLDKPSFTTSFISRHLRKNENFTLKHYYTINKQIRGSKYIRNDDILIIQNLSERNIQSISTEVRKAMFRHINEGGKAIFIIPESDPMTIQNYFFPHTPMFRRATKTNDAGGNLTLTLTNEGKKASFLTFNNSKTAQKHWDRLNYYDEPKYTIKTGREGTTLAHIKDKPALIKSKHRNIVAFLFKGLWRTDFLNQSYGLDTTYLPDLLDELISKEFNPMFEESLIKIEKQILEFGEETNIYFNPNLVDKNKLKIINNAGEHKLYPITENERLTSRFRAKALGENKIYEGDKLLGEIYVRYPQDENQTPNYKLIENLAKETGGAVIKDEDLEEISAYFKKEVKKNIETHKKVLVNVYLFFGIIILLLCIEWIIRKKFLL